MPATAAEAEKRYHTILEGVAVSFSTLANFSINILWKRKFTPFRRHVSNCGL